MANSAIKYSLGLYHESIAKSVTTLQTIFKDNSFQIITQCVPMCHSRTQTA